MLHHDTSTVYAQMKENAIFPHLLSPVLSLLNFQKVGLIEFKVLRPTRHKISYFEDILPSQSLGLVLKN